MNKIKMLLVEIQMKWLLWRLKYFVENDLERIRIQRKHLELARFRAAARKHLGARPEESLMDALTSHKDVGAFRDEWKEIKRRCCVPDDKQHGTAAYILKKFNDDEKTITNLNNMLLKP